MEESREGVLDEIRVLLAEKRTSLSVLRTGLALFTVPISVFTILTAASEYYRLENIFPLFILLVSICVVLIVLGTYLLVRALRRIHRIDLRVRKLKENIADIDI